ncbi:MAG: hypothetical protein B9S32_03075 [Verrucomicrobia bacterium Tous-C9LFEB]|nr:MAG: hypothetical protein B9S32_03075 [Verrucomicrobia bacterium Tous-C9LFEB]
MFLKSPNTGKRGNAEQVVVVKLQATEKKILKSHARRCGLSSSDFVRVAITQYFLAHQAYQASRDMARR